MDIHESQSSGTLSSAGGDESSNDEDDDYEPIHAISRDSILGGKLQHNRRLSTASSNINYNYMGHFSENTWNDDGLGLMGDKQSGDDSDVDPAAGELNAEALLEQEHEKLAFFDESLKQCNKLAGKMTAVLQNLQDKLKKLQTTLDPIRKDTTEVASAERNINRTMAELQKVMQYHQLTTEPLDSIRKKTLKTAPTRKENADGDGDEWSDPFLVWIEKINEARNYFEENQFKSSERAMESLKNIAQIALERMESYFRDLLKQHTLRNKRVIDQMVGYKLMDRWKHRDPSYPLWTNQLMNGKKRRRGGGARDELSDGDDEVVTDLLYVPPAVIQRLANVALRIEQTSTCHSLKDNLAELVIAPRSNLLVDILKELSNENVLTIMYIQAYHENALKTNTRALFSNKKKVNNVKRSEVDGQSAAMNGGGGGVGGRSSLSLNGHDMDHPDLEMRPDFNSPMVGAADPKRSEMDQLNGMVALPRGRGTAVSRNSRAMEMAELAESPNADEDEKKSTNPFGVLSASALDQLNTYNQLNEDVSTEAVMAIAIDIKSQSHPVVLLLHISLSLFQLERHLCSTILDVKNEVLLEFDEFFNDVVAEPLKLLIKRVEQVLEVKDVMAVTRNAQARGGGGGRRMSMQQIGNLANSNIPIEEAAKLTARSTAKAAIVNDSIHQNMVLVKLDLVAAFLKLFGAFDKVLNQSQDYGVDDEDEDDRMGHNEHRHNGGGGGADHSELSHRAADHSRRGMVHLSRLRERVFSDCHSTLEERVRMIRDHKEIKNVRVDGGYHPLTIETVKLLFGVYEFQDALQQLYDEQKAPTMQITVSHHRSAHHQHPNRMHRANSNILKKRQIEKTLLALIKALQKNLTEKSKTYGNNRKSLEYIFMLNNFHYILKTVSGTDLEAACGQEVMDGLRTHIERYKKLYEKASWEKVREFIDVSRLRSDYFTDKVDNLSTKEKKPIKNRYGGFNKEFQEQLQAQQSYNVPDPNLRAELIKRNIDVVLPMYRVFVAKFKNIEFTKDRGKYHKYDEKTLHEKMQQFFQCQF